jgi:tRNA-dihydrouridine synthase B
MIVTSPWLSFIIYFFKVLLIKLMTIKLKIGSMEFDNQLIQGPLAGVSCAPFRELFSLYQKPAYCVTEMISAQDVMTKHSPIGRYLYKSPHEGRLAYQLSGQNPAVMSQAAHILEQLGADIIDINCGCPKPKIRKKGAGSALLDTPDLLVDIVRQMKNRIQIPLTVKIRLQTPEQSIKLSQRLEQAGADAIIVHGRTVEQDYDVGCHYPLIATLKQKITIPIITNGDIKDKTSLKHAIKATQTDGYMIARAGCGKPWLYQELLQESFDTPGIEKRLELFMTHLEKLSALENEFKALLQARTLIRYYFREFRDKFLYEELFQTTSIADFNLRLFNQMNCL